MTMHTQIEHTIQWARDCFEGWFSSSCSEVNRYLTQSDYLPELAKQVHALIFLKSKW